MRILWLLPLIPFPADTGGKQDTYFMIREFSRLGDDITCGIIYNEENPPEVPPEFSSLVKANVFLPGNPKPLHSRLMSSLSDDIPFKFRKYYSTEAVEAALDHLESEQDFDCIIVDHLHLAPLALDIQSRYNDKFERFPPLILRTPNVESTIVKKYAQRIPNPLVKAFATREARKMVAYESKVLDEFDLVAAISPVDQKVFQKASKNPERIISVTAGVDVETLQTPDTQPTPGEVTYVGSFDWQPNVDAAKWLVEKVWPTVLKKVPDAHLSLVGRKPPPYLEELASDSITLTGWVDSVEEYVSRSTCCVVPLWIGSGMRFKILEAFALGRAVVSTSLGAEGIEIEDGVNILIRDKPKTFAEGIIGLLTDSDLRNRLGENARSLVESKYTWTQVAKGFRHEIAKLA